MANLGFALRSSFGFLPSTEKIESTQQKLEEDYQRLKEIEASEELKEYTALEEYIQSSAFIDKKNEILSLDYKKTEEFTNEKSFFTLSKDKKIKHYFKILNSELYKAFLNTKESNELAEYVALTEEINSDNHKNEKNTLQEALKVELAKAKELKQLKKDKRLAKHKKIKSSSAYQEYQNNAALLLDDSIDEEQKKSSAYKTALKFQQSGKLEIINSIESSGILEQFNELNEYVSSSDYNQAIESLKYENSKGYQAEQKQNSLKTSESIKQYLKFDKSKAYTLFCEVETSESLKEYFRLDELVKSEDFIAHKTYMLDKDKFSKTEESQKENRFIEITKSDNIIWHKATKSNNKFDQLHQWKLSFEDKFDGNKIDTDKWMNSFFWGKMLINDRYVLAGDKQYFTDNKNAVCNGSSLQLITKAESAKGKVWHPVHGFSEQEFKYTSGMLSTGHNFRQKYGKFEAKIKLDPSYPVYQAFWLKGEKIVPEIDVFKFNMNKKNRLQLASHWANGDGKTNSTTEKLNGSPFTKKFHIFTLEWSPEKITWSINGIEVYTTSENIPDEPMYILLSAGVSKEPKGEAINAAYEIDWVRCYEKSE